MTNVEMEPAEVREYFRTDTAAQNLLRVAMRHLRLSARSYDRVLMLARTSADLAGSVAIGSAHLAAAVQYQPRERV